MIYLKSERPDIEKKRIKLLKLQGEFIVKLRGFEDELLEKWGRDSKIIDIFEGTQQIQQLIVARRLLGLTSKELK